MTRIRSSPIWNIERDDLAELVAKAQTFSGVLRHFGLNHMGGNCRTLKARLVAESIDFSHIAQGRNSSRGRRLGGAETPLTEILIESSPYRSRGRLKKRVMRAGLLKNRCAICDLDPTWNGKGLVLVLDHINGCNDDHRIENLRLLCPNCNSQTETFCGRRKAYQNQLVSEIESSSLGHGRVVRRLTLNQEIPGSKPGGPAKQKG